MTDPTNDNTESWHQQIDPENNLLIVDQDGGFIADLGPLDESFYSDDPAEAKAAIETVQKDANILTGAKRLLRAAQALLSRDAKTEGGITKGWGGEVELAALQVAVDMCSGKLPLPAPDALSQTEGNA